MKRLIALLVVLAATVGATPASPRVSSLSLPAGQYYELDALSGGRLLASGDAASGNDCQWSVIDEAQLRIATTLRGDCARPPVTAHPHEPVITYLRNSMRAEVRIDGTVLFTFNDVSDTKPEIAYGARTIWIYDVATTHGPEVAEVSAATGALERIVAMPRIYRPTLAADADGLWFGPSPESGVSGAARLERLQPGARAPQVVHRGGRAELWLVAAGHTLWADVISGATSQEIWRFDGPTSRGRTLASADELAGEVAGPALDPDRAALWTLSYTPNRSDDCPTAAVVRIDARTGRQQVATRIAMLGSQCYDLGGQVFARGALYVLDTAAQPNVLYRIRT